MEESAPIQVRNMRQDHIDWVVHRSVCLEFGLLSKPTGVAQRPGRQREVSPQCYSVTLPRSANVVYIDR